MLTPHKVFVTYMVDCHPLHGAEVGTYVNLNRMVLGFVGKWMCKRANLDVWF